MAWGHRESTGEGSGSWPAPLGLPLLLLSLNACTPVRPIETARLTTGATVASLATAADSTVFVVYDPATCLTCGGRVARWLQIPAAAGHVVKILLAAPPSSEQLYQLTIARIPIAGVLKDHVHPSPPLEALFVSSELRLVEHVPERLTADRSTLLTLMDPQPHHQ